MHEEHMATALISAAAMGQRVAVFARTGAEARELFVDFGLRLPAGYAVESVRTSGREAFGFTASGGTVRFYSLGSGGHRGWSADRVFVPVGTGPEVLAAIVPAMATSGVRLLTGY